VSGEPRWITKDGLLILHDRSLALHGGASGVRDEGLLESALARPANRYHYEGVEDLMELAATYAAAVSANHPFIDGNKRAAFLAAGLFLGKHGLVLDIGQTEAAAMVLSLAAGEVDIPTLTAWLRANVRPVDPPAPSAA
jgi:death-on-curing protein